MKSIDQRALRPVGSGRGDAPGGAGAGTVAPLAPPRDRAAPPASDSRATQRAAAAHGADDTRTAGAGGPRPGAAIEGVHRRRGGSDTSPSSGRGSRGDTRAAR